MRQRWYERQLAPGVIPPGTELAPRNPGVEAWDSLPENQQRLACSAAGGVRRVPRPHRRPDRPARRRAPRASGELDNTLLVVLADNGASQEGGPFGVMHEMKFFNGILETPDQAIDRIDDIGGPHSHTNYPWGWAQCGNTPFKWYKQNTHEGGVHVPMIVHWPAGSRPTSVAACAASSSTCPTSPRRSTRCSASPPPAVFRGIEQLPVTGHSFVSVLADPARRPRTSCSTSRWPAAGPSSPRRRWKAVCRHVQGADFDTEPWELYDLAADASECNDLAARMPEQLDELIGLWWEQAESHGVAAARRSWHRAVRRPLPRPLAAPASRRYVYRPPMSPIPAQASAAIGGRSFDLTARVTRGPGDEGVLWATGTENSGISVFVQHDRLVVDYNAFDDHTVVESAIPVPVGDVDAHGPVPARRRA